MLWTGEADLLVRFDQGRDELLVCIGQWSGRK